MTKAYREYLKSPAWLQLRAEVLEWHKGRCAYCGRPATAVHHEEYEEGSLKPVCGRCHCAAHGIVPRRNATHFTDEKKDAKEFVSF